MLDFTDIIISFFSILLMLLTSILLGGALQLLIKKIYTNANHLSIDLGLFWKMMVGSVLLISLFAIVSARGTTLFLIIPLILFFFVKNKLLGAEKVEHSKGQLIFLLCSVLFNFLFYLWAINSFNTDSVSYVSGDFNIYFRMAQRLNEFGIESLNLDPIYSAKYASPYHYGDLWMYALVSRFVSTNPSVVYLVAFTHFSVLFINGVYTFVYQRFKTLIGNKTGFLYLIIFAGLFTGFNFFFPKFIVPSAEPYTLSVMNWSKVLVPSCFLISLLILSKEKNWWALVLLVMVAGLSFINALPAMFMTIFLVLSINLLRKQITIKKWLSLHIVYVLSTILFLVVLYKVWPNLIGASTQEATGVEIKKAIEIKTYLSTAIKIFIGGWFQLFVLMPFLIVLSIGLLIMGQLKHLKKRIIGLDNDILFLIFIVFSGLSCWAVLHPFAPDAVQFYTNILAPTYAIAISFLVMYVLYVFKNKYLSILTIAILAVNIFVHKSDVFFVNKDSRLEWNKAASFLGSKNVGHRFVNIQPVNHFNSFFDKNTVYFMPLGHLNYLWPDYHNFSLNAPFIPVNESSLYANEERIELDLAPFSIFYKEQLKQSNQSSEEIIKSFIQVQDIGYISVSKDTILPSFLRTHIKDSIDLEKANYIVYRIR